MKQKKASKKNTNKGFTLIELLVVVAIIAILAAISVVALNNARARARDAKRLADIKQIQTALELYYLDNNGYPSSLSDLSSGDTIYMANVPSAPNPCDCPTGCPAGGDTYTYATVGSSPYTSYTLKYCLGSDSGGISAGVRTATPSGITD